MNVETDNESYQNLMLNDYINEVRTRPQGNTKVEHSSTKKMKGFIESLPRFDLT